MKRHDMLCYLVERLEFEFPGRFGLDVHAVAEIVLDSVEGKGMKPPKRPINTTYGMAFEPTWQEDDELDPEQQRYEQWLATHGRNVG